jgi:hypothetical protein
LSCAWFLLSVAIDLTLVRAILIGGFTVAGRDWIAALVTGFFLIHPLLVLCLIIRAIRRRNVGRPLRVLSRALLALAPALVIIGTALGLRYRDEQAWQKRVNHMKTYGISYVCSQAADNDHKVIELRLVRTPRPNGLEGWTVARSREKPTKAVGFSIDTGSIGGSQGIRWTEPDGQHKVAYLSFSDLVAEFGTTTIFMEMRQDLVATPDFDPGRSPSTRLICNLDPANYGE